MNNIAKAINSVRHLGTQDFLTIAAILEHKFSIITTISEIGDVFDAGLIQEDEDATWLVIPSTVKGAW